MALATRTKKKRVSQQTVSVVKVFLLLAPVKPHKDFFVLATLCRISIFKALEHLEVVFRARSRTPLLSIVKVKLVVHSPASQES
jgi:hypothetical protein